MKKLLPALRDFRLLLCFLVFVPGIPGYSQILQDVKPSHHLDMSEDSLLPGTSKFIGNYPIRRADSMDIHGELSELAAQRWGTLFFVISPRQNSLPDTTLLQLGAIRVYRDSIMIGGRKVKFSHLDHKSSIVKIKYQILKDDGEMPGGKVFIHPDVELAEVIRYGRFLKGDEERIVESYLAMKYSINITKNTDPSLRKYLDIRKHKVWGAGSDQLYNEEVLALGRLDDAKFYQSQTYTADSRAYRLSLNPSVRGGMPAHFLDEGSLLVMSKRSDSALSGQCGEEVRVRPWKLKFLNWNTPAHYIYLTMDSLPPGFSSPVITDGQYTQPVQVQTVPGGVTLRIPLPYQNQDEDHYLEWTEDREDCDTAFFYVKVRPCDTNIQGSGVEIRVDEELLPCEIDLRGHYPNSPDQAMTETMQYSTALIDSLPAGHYTLELSNDSAFLSHEVFWIPVCDSSQTPHSLSVFAEDWVFTDDFSNSFLSSSEDTNSPGEESSFGKNSGGEGHGESRGISIYPNPGRKGGEVFFEFRGHEDREFDILIFDNKSTLIHRDKFVPEEEGVYPYRFAMQGTYLVRFISPSYIHNERVVIAGD